MTVPSDLDEYPVFVEDADAILHRSWAIFEMWSKYTHPASYAKAREVQDAADADADRVDAAEAERRGMTIPPVYVDSFGVYTRKKEAEGDVDCERMRVEHPAKYARMRRVERDILHRWMDAMDAEYSTRAERAKAVKVNDAIVMLTGDAVDTGHRRVLVFGHDAMKEA